MTSRISKVCEHRQGSGIIVLCLMHCMVMTPTMSASSTKSHPSFPTFLLSIHPILSLSTNGGIRATKQSQMAAHYGVRSLALVKFKHSGTSLKTNHHPICQFKFEGRKKFCASKCRTKCWGPVARQNKTINFHSTSFDEHWQNNFAAWQKILCSRFL